MKFYLGFQMVLFIFAATFVVSFMYFDVYRPPITAADFFISAIVGIVISGLSAFFIFSGNKNNRR